MVDNMSLCMIKSESSKMRGMGRGEWQGSHIDGEHGMIDEQGWEYGCILSIGMNVPNIGEQGYSVPLLMN